MHLIIFIFFTLCVSSALSPFGERMEMWNVKNNFVVPLVQMALDILDWAGFKDVSCVIESQMNLVQGSGKTVRNIYAVLLARGTVRENPFCVQSRLQYILLLSRIWKALHSKWIKRCSSLQKMDSWKMWS